MTYESKRELRTSRDTYRRGYEANRKTIESLTEERDQLRRTVEYLADELGIGENYRDLRQPMREWVYMDGRRKIEPDGDVIVEFDHKLLARDIEAHCRQEAATQRLTPITKAGGES